MIKTTNINEVSIKFLDVSNIQGVSEIDENTLTVDFWSKNNLFVCKRMS